MVGKFFLVSWLRGSHSGPAALSQENVASLTAGRAVTDNFLFCETVASRSPPKLPSSTFFFPRFALAPIVLACSMHFPCPRVQRSPTWFFCFGHLAPAFTLSTFPFLPLVHWGTLPTPNLLLFPPSCLLVLFFFSFSCLALFGNALVSPVVT